MLNLTSKVDNFCPHLIVSRITFQCKQRAKFFFKQFEFWANLFKFSFWQFCTGQSIKGNTAWSTKWFY